MLIELLKNYSDPINTIANIFTALGTVSAIMFAIILASKGNKPNIKGTAGVRFIIKGHGALKDAPGYVRIEAKNLSKTPIKITEFGWEVGVFRKKFAIQSYEIADSHLSTALPKIISYGKTVHYMIPVQDFPILAAPSKYKFINAIKVKFYYLLVHDGLGHTVHFRIDRSLQLKILKYLNTQITEPSQPAPDNLEANLNPE
jgi:hypothetical protein